MSKPTKQELKEFLYYAKQSYSDLETQVNSIPTRQIIKDNANATIFYTKGQAIVSIRGTDDAYDWLSNMNALPVNIADYVNTKINLRVHQGFLSYTLSLYDEIKEAIGDKPYSLTGHSLGSSSATLFSILYYIDTGKKPIRFINFASPRVIFGDTKDFDNTIELYRVAINDDLVVFFPPKNIGYRHVGTPLLWNAVFLEQPQYYPKGYDEDQQTTYFRNQLFGIGKTFVGTKAVKIFLIKVFDIFSKYKGFHTKSTVDRNTIYNYIFTTNYADTRMTDREQHLEEVVNSIRHIKLNFPSWDTFIETIDVNDIDSSKDIYQALIDTYTTSIISFVKQISIDNTLPNLIPTFQIIEGNIIDLENDLETLIQSVEEASEDFDIQEEEIYGGLRKVGSEVLDETFKATYDTSNNRINQMLEETQNVLDKTTPITNSIVLLKHIFTLINNVLSYGTIGAYQEYIYNTISMVAFHGLNKYEELILNMDTDRKQTIEINTSADVIEPDIIFNQEGNQIINTTTEPTETLYADGAYYYGGGDANPNYNVGSKPPEETRQIEIANFYDEFTKVGKENGNHIYTDGENDYILEGNKETTYLRHKQKEPKILGYIVMTDGIKNGDVVIY